MASFTLQYDKRQIVLNASVWGVTALASLAFAVFPPTLPEHGFSIVRLLGPAGVSAIFLLLTVSLLWGVWWTILRACGSDIAAAIYEQGVQLNQRGRLKFVRWNQISSVETGAAASRKGNPTLIVQYRDDNDGTERRHVISPIFLRSSSDEFSIWCDKLKHCLAAPAV